MIVYVSFFEIDYGFEKCLWYVVIRVRNIYVNYCDLRLIVL